MRKLVDHGKRMRAGCGETDAGCRHRPNPLTLAATAACDGGGRVMASATSTHEVLNQSTPFEDVNLYTLDVPLQETVKREGGASAETRLAQLPTVFTRSVVYTSWKCAAAKSASVAPSGPCTVR